MVQRLLQQASRIGVKPRDLLLDRGFYRVAVVRYLQAARYPFLMPVARHGRKPRDPEKWQSVWQFFAWKRSGWSEHQGRDNEGRLATVSICVVYGSFATRGKPRRSQTLVYAYGGFRPRWCAWDRETYCLRFAIETPCRQRKQARIRTCTRDPLLQLLFVGLALMLRNVWVWLHLRCVGPSAIAVAWNCVWSDSAFAGCWFGSNTTPSGCSVSTTSLWRNIRCRPDLCHIVCEGRNLELLSLPGPRPKPEHLNRHAATKAPPPGTRRDALYDAVG